MQLGRTTVLLATLAFTLGGVTAANAAATALPGQAPASLPASIKAEIAAGDAGYIDRATLAASGCGRLCDGKNPRTYRLYYNGCAHCYYYCSDDAITAKVQPVSHSPKIDLRYSPRCRTAWTKVYHDLHWPTIRSYYLDGRLRTSYAGYVGQYYTNMVDDANLEASACSDVGSGLVYCTAKY